MHATANKRKYEQRWPKQLQACLRKVVKNEQKLSAEIAVSIPCTYTFAEKNPKYSFCVEAMATSN